MIIEYLVKNLFFISGIFFFYEATKAAITYCTKSNTKIEIREYSPIISSRIPDENDKAKHLTSWIFFDRETFQSIYLQVSIDESNPSWREYKKYEE